MRLAIVILLAGLVGCAGSSGSQAGEGAPLRREETEVLTLKVRTPEAR